MEAYGLEVEEELSTVATQYRAEGVWMEKWYHEQREAWTQQVREVQMWREVRGPAGAVMCETRDLGIKWLHWHTVIFEGDSKHRHEICLRDRREKDVPATGQVGLLEEVGSKARTRRVEGGELVGAGSGLAAQENEGKNGRRNNRHVARKLFFGRRMGAEAALRYWSDESKCQACHKEVAHRNRTGSTIVQGGTKSDGGFQMLSESGSKKQEPQSGSGQSGIVSASSQ